MATRGNRYVGGPIPGFPTAPQFTTPTLPIAPQPVMPVQPFPPGPVMPGPGTTPPPQPPVETPPPTVPSDPVNDNNAGIRAEIERLKRQRDQLMRQVQDINMALKKLKGKLGIGGLFPQPMPVGPTPVGPTPVGPTPVGPPTIPQPTPPPFPFPGG